MPRSGSTLRLLRLSLAAAFAIAMFPVAQSTAIAEEQGINLDPKSDAFGISGWSRRVAETGTIFYTCERDSCGKGSTVSLRRQPPGPAPTADAMKRNEARIEQAMRERLGNKIARIDISEPKLESDRVFSLGEITRTYVPAPGVDPGLQLHWKSGFVSTSAALYTIVSSSDTRALCAGNYGIFQTALMLSLARGSASR